jgi:hypothetical protein
VRPFRSCPVYRKERTVSVFIASALIRATKPLADQGRG